MITEPRPQASTTVPEAASLFRAATLTVPWSNADAENVPRNN